jgi:hypothetical protein
LVLEGDRLCPWCDKALVPIRDSRGRSEGAKKFSERKFCNKFCREAYDRNERQRQYLALLKLTPHPDNGHVGHYVDEFPDLLPNKKGEKSFICTVCGHQKPCLVIFPGDFNPHDQVKSGVWEGKTREWNLPWSPVNDIW